MLKRFHFRPIPFIACIVVFAIGIALGNWQTRRAAEKQGMADALKKQSTKPAYAINGKMLSSEKVAFRPVKARGKFNSQWAIYLDNRPLNGVAGFYVLMPLQLENSDDVVMVMRGWMPRNPVDRKQLATLNTPEGIVEVDGVVRTSSGNVMQLGTPDKLHANAIVQNVTTQEIAKITGWKVMDLMLEQHSDNGDGLKRDWPAASFGIEKHQGYAFQWYGLALMTLIFYVVTGFRRGKK
jgi:surfeit locus 1 family protein